MLWLCITIIALGALICVFYVREKIKAYSVKSVVIKTVVSLLFVLLAAYCSFTKGNHPINTFIIFGLVLGLVGDIVLDLKYVYPKDDKIYTYTGFIVFLLGHIFYIVGMYLEFFNDVSILYLIIPIAVAIVLGFANLFLAKPLKLNYGDLKLICLFYAMVLFANPLCSLSLLIANGWKSTSLIMMFVGGLLFAASDLVLSGTYFGEGHERPIDFILNYLTYYGAQYIIAFSIFFL